MATVAVPESLARLFPGMPRRFEAPPGSAWEVLRAVDARYPGFSDRLCEGPAVVRQHILLFVDGALAQLSTPVGEGGELLVVPALSGG
jgi:hypothetical protein